MPDYTLLANRQKLIEKYNINLIIDIGANEGQYAQTCRSIGYKDRIISFEPVSVAFNKMQEISIKDDLWDTYHMAIGEDNYEKEINISEVTYCSSFLSATETVLKAAPVVNYVDSEVVKVFSLDTLFEDLKLENENIYLKIDTQGFEREVLKGAKKSLKKVKGIQIETSFIQLYKGEMLIDELISFLYKEGFHLESVEPGFGNEESGQMYQADLIFFKN